MLFRLAVAAFVAALILSTFGDRFGFAVSMAASSFFAVATLVTRKPIDL